MDFLSLQSPAPFADGDRPTLGMLRSGIVTPPSTTEFVCSVPRGAWDSVSTQIRCGSLVSAVTFGIACRGSNVCSIHGGDTGAAVQLLCSCCRCSMSWETLSCQLPTQWHRGLARVQAETAPRELGAKSWKDVLGIRWHLSATEARRQLVQAADLGPRRAFTGEPLAPVLAATAAPQAAGSITAEHVDKIRDAMARLPGFIDSATREQIETDLVGLAVGVGPAEVKKAADTVLFLLDQDGPAPDDTERARKRGLHVGPQHGDGTVDVRGHPDPGSVGDL